MRRSLATVSICAAGLAPALLALSLAPLMPGAASADPFSADGSIGAAPSEKASFPHDDAGQQPTSSLGLVLDCEATSRSPEDIADARAYILETANPGYTMTLQGPEVAIGRLHPEFVARLANAIREARDSGRPEVGIFSAYRPPAFGVGGFVDKFNSLHTYGLAVDMYGIGKPGSQEARQWHEIAARNGVVCPYGPRDRAEWNHCQPTSLKIILPENPLRETVAAKGPFDLGTMFDAGNAVIESMASAADSLSKAAPTPVRALEAEAKGLEPSQEATTVRKAKRRSPARRIATKSVRHPNSGKKPIIALRGVRSKPIIAVEERPRKSRASADAG